MEVALLAPGPSMSQALADSLRGQMVGVVGNCFELAPWAAFLVAQDRAWWRSHPAAMTFAGRRFSANRIDGLELVPGAQTRWNSGVLALHAAVHCIGAGRIWLYGFDMRGTHYFGPYTNGLSNTTAASRDRHLKQYRAWAATHRSVEVINCTPGSALDCFPHATSIAA